MACFECWILLEWLLLLGVHTSSFLTDFSSCIHIMECSTWQITLQGDIGLFNWLECTDYHLISYWLFLMHAHRVMVWGKFLYLPNSCLHFAGWLNLVPHALLCPITVSSALPFKQLSSNWLAWCLPWIVSALVWWCAAMLVIFSLQLVMVVQLGNVINTL